MDKDWMLAKKDLLKQEISNLKELLRVTEEGSSKFGVRHGFESIAVVSSIERSIEALSDAIWHIDNIMSQEDLRKTSTPSMGE